jgi:replication factor C subunit 2/4
MKVMLMGYLLDPARQPWVEKYRPKSIDDVAAQDHTVSVLRKTLGSANVHLLAHPPPNSIFPS